MRPRSAKTKHLPPNLRERNGYYSWCDPRTGKEYGIGRDKLESIKQAREANAFLSSGSLVERLSGPRRTVSDLIPLYREVISKRGLAPKTLAQRNTHIKAITKSMGQIVIGATQEDAVVITFEASKLLKSYNAKGQDRTAKAIRSTLSDMFSVAAGEGWTAVNPILALRTAPVIVRRQRLTLEDFKAVYQKADERLKRAMEVALVTLQRREDVSRMTFRDVREGFLHVEQGKTKMRLRIPTTIRLEALGWSLSDILSRCRDSVLSRFIVHHGEHQGRASPGDPVHHQTLGNLFKDAREKTDIPVSEGKTPPTFHEIRSLGARLYIQQGYDPQALLGHKDAKTTAVYRDNRGAEWVTVKSGTNDA